MKRFMVMGTVLLLTACGHHEVRVSASIGSLIVPGTSPWLSVPSAPEKVVVRGAGHKLSVEPTPGMSDALQTQLGLQLKQDYFSYLTVKCTQVAARINVDQDKLPGIAEFDLSMQCLIFARGYTSTHNYEVKPTAHVDAGAGDQGYAQAFPALLSAAAEGIAVQLRDDIKHTASQDR